MHPFDVRSFGHFTNQNVPRCQDEFYYVDARNYNIFTSTCAWCCSGWVFMHMYVPYISS